MEEGMKVQILPDPDGDYVLGEEREDGSVVLWPDPAIKAWHEGHGYNPRTSAAAIRRRLGSEPISDEEFERHFGHLPSDGEG